jgi:hypothetical protein
MVFIERERLVKYVILSRNEGSGRLWINGCNDVTRCFTSFSMATLLFIAE